MRVKVYRVNPDTAPSVGGIFARCDTGQVVAEYVTAFATDVGGPAQTRGLPVYRVGPVDFEVEVEA
jgi:hypothetical protein